MTHQNALFHDSIYDALAADVAAIGGVKKASALLWPNHSNSEAKLRGCLSAEHAQKFDPEDIIAIKRMARDAGSTATVNYEAQQLGYRFEWTAPEDEQARLQREFIHAVEKLEQIKRGLSNNESRLRVAR